MRRVARSLTAAAFGVSSVACGSGGHAAAGDAGLDAASTVDGSGAADAGSTVGNEGGAHDGGIQRRQRGRRWGCRGQSHGNDGGPGDRLSRIHRRVHARRPGNRRPYAERRGALVRGIRNIRDDGNPATVPGWLAMHQSLRGARLRADRPGRRGHRRHGRAAERRRCAARGRGPQRAEQLPRHLPGANLQLHDDLRAGRGPAEGPLCRGEGRREAEPASPSFTRARRAAPNPTT